MTGSKNLDGDSPEAAFVLEVPEACPAPQGWPALHGSRDHNGLPALISQLKNRGDVILSQVAAGGGDTAREGRRLHHVVHEKLLHGGQPANLYHPVWQAFRHKGKASDSGMQRPEA